MLRHIVFFVRTFLAMCTVPLIWELAGSEDQAVRVGGDGGEIPQTCQPLAGGYLSASLCSRKEKISINVRKLSVFISKLMFARNILEIFPV